MRIAQFVHSLFSWVLATALVCILLVVFYYYHRGDEELRRYVEQAIAKKCPHHSVKIGSANLIPGEGVRLREVSVVKIGSRQQQSRAELAFCDEIQLQCNPSIQELLDGKINVRRILCRGLLLQPTRNANGKWNLAELIPEVPAESTVPTIEIENARVEVHDYAGQQPTQLTLNNVNITVSPSPHEAGKLLLRSDFDSKHFQLAEVEATIDPQKPANWSGSGKIANLSCNEVLNRTLAGQSVAVPPLLDGLSAVAQVTFALAKGESETHPRFTVEAQVSNGKFEAPRFLTHPVTDITIPLIRCMSNGEKNAWAIQNGTANYGTAKVLVTTAYGPSFSSSSDINADVTLDNLTITRELVGILPAQHQELWNKYQPLGVVDLKAKSRRRGGRWTTNANAICKDISLQCEKFSYPLTRCHGTVNFRQNTDLKVELWAAPDRTWATNPIHIVADVFNPGKQFTGEIKIGMRPTEWLPIDARIHNAIPPTVHKVLSDMGARGELNFNTTLRRTLPDQVELSKETFIEVQRGGLKHEGFPYPLQNVSGKLHLKDSEYRFYDFRGSNDSCLVTCDGEWLAPTSTTPSLLNLEIVAKDIPCDTELREALPAGPRQVWRGLRPAGTIDHAVINLTHRSGMVKPEIGIVVTQLGHDNDPDRRSLEMQPTWFPLAMDRVTGEFRFMPNGSFSLKNIQAQHGSIQRTVNLRTNGGGLFREDGSWQILLDRVIADRIETTPEFIAALPKNLSEALRALKFQGTLFVNADKVQFTGNSDPSIPIEANWNATINVDNGEFILAQHPVKNLFGQVSVSGRRQQGNWINSGHAKFDTLFCRGVHVTNLNSPWFMDSARFVFGKAVQMPGSNPSPATAEVFTGKASATGQIDFTKNVDFGFELAVNDFDIGHRDLKMPTRISGRGDASLTLQGNSQGNHTLRGAGGIRLRDANLAELPAIIKLLNTMRINKRRRDAFTSSEIDFRIDGPTALLDHFDLHGESLSLKGQGRLELDRRVNLRFYSLFGGEKIYRPFALLAKQTSENLMQILVTGTIDNLKLTTEMGPGWKELFPDQPALAIPRIRDTRR